MEILYLTIFIPCSLSILSCLVFLYFFFRFESVRYTFGMKYVAILQLADLLIPLAFIFNILFHNSEINCISISFTVNFFMIFQSFWVAVITTFSYRVLCLNVEKENISVLKPAIFGITISAFTSTFPIFFNCYKPVENVCGLKCDLSIEFILFAISITIIGSSLIISIYLTFLLLKKLKRDLKSQSKEMKWSFIRLSVYPFITFVCSCPGIVCFFIMALGGSLSTSMIVGSSWIINLIGFFNSISLGFTREFKEALRFNKRKKVKPLIN